jgi:hypothetical protein
MSPGLRGSAHRGRVVVAAAVLPWILGLAPDPPVVQRDVFLSGLVLYTRLAANSPEAKKHGTNPQITSYDLHGGLAPDKIDAIVVVNGNPPDPVTIVLEVFPVVGLTNWVETEGITDTQLLADSKTRLASVLKLEKPLSVRGRTQVEFKDIDLLAIVNHYKKLGFWPAELVFRATAAPVAGETSLSNNVMELVFPVKPPD